jgi:sulfur-carrier protein
MDGIESRSTVTGGDERRQGGKVAVEVRIPTVFRKFTGGESVVEVQAGTISDLIDQLETRYPGLKEQLLTEDGELHRFVNVYVNDEDARYLEKLDTKVAEGETVAILPSVAGG